MGLTRRSAFLYSHGQVARIRGVFRQASQSSHGPQSSDGEAGPGKSKVVSYFKTGLEMRERLNPPTALAMGLTARELSEP